MKLRNKKTREIIDLDEWSFDSYDDKLYIARGDAEGDNIEYFNSLADLCSKYEDCKPTEPAEPLIKDEKVRKAVRAWAESLGADKVFVEKPSFEHNRFILSVSGYYEVGFDIDIPENIKPCKSYTTAELCGEGEE